MLKVSRGLHHVITWATFGFTGTSSSLAVYISFCCIYYFTVLYFFMLFSNRLIIVRRQIMIIKLMNRYLVSLALLLRKEEVQWFSLGAIDSSLVPQFTKMGKSEWTQGGSIILVDSDLGAFIDLKPLLWNVSYIFSPSVKCYFSGYLFPDSEFDFILRHNAY